jgi:flagellar hook assembly protein FlgD
MKNKYVLLLISFTVLIGIPMLKAQTIYISFKDGTRTSYSLSNVRSITLANDLMNLNKKDGTTDSWNVNSIGNYNYSGFESGVKTLEIKSLKDLSVYPNPTNGSINIQYQLQQPAEPIIELLDINGKLIKALPQQHQEIGNYTLTWNGSGDNDNYINAGIYFCRIMIGNESISKKIIVTNK